MLVREIRSSDVIFKTSAGGMLPRRETRLLPALDCNSERKT
jgi:hypothetical protein